MGTNFYRKPILTKERKEKLHQLVEEEKFESNWDNENIPDSSVVNMIHWLTDGVHICKRSAGWYIGFDHNWGKYYEPNRKALEDFLSEPGYQIVDEYGEEYTPEEFWKMVDEWNSTPNRDGSELWDSKAYTEWEQKQHPTFHQIDYAYQDKIRVEEKWGIHCDFYDFKVDGLRFSVFSEFC